MNTIQISIKAAGEQQEILISQMEECNANGFEQLEDRLIAYFPENNFDSYQLNQLLQGYDYTITTLEDRNWNQVWESNFQPVTVGNFCAIRADFHETIKNVEHEIVITPKMSFGTGHHATTYMMVQQMKDIDFTGKTVFDFGTGTGILAILADKLGAAGVWAIDVDDWSISNAKENIEKNNCAAINLTLSATIPQKQFEIILANINRNVILQYLPELKKRLVTNGFVLFSGLLITDKEDILTACTENELKLVKQLEKNNWISLLFMNSKQ